MTRPDISFAVNHLSQFLQCPTTSHWQAIKRILRYIKGTQNYGLLFHPSCDLLISAYSDADWAANVDDRRSVAAYCVFLGGNLVSWSSKKQNFVARSSTESEYRVIAHALAELIGLTNYCRKLGLCHLHLLCCGVTMSAQKLLL
ncbi:secreted RxLR effector protein 161-like [Benincasa hispida]|uniref:secreted RxLR effector protein 161-like n=1 Tax=Benincasa hispida TaxID=102211 RepID=UPI0019001B33|nr:secreted RxLR effector protein 161-like [Benincasa hispida]